jgi:LacI family transcriptional regulator
MADVAADAGVSRATVSLVSRDSPQISLATKKKVHASMERLGYVYNRTAGQLRAMRTGTYGLILTALNNFYFAAISAAVTEAASGLGRMVLHGYSLGNPVLEAKILRSMAEARVDGVVILTANEFDAASIRAALGQAGIPLVQILRPTRGIEGDSVVIDDFEAGRLLGTHLGEVGVKTAGWIGGFERATMVDARIAGMRAGLAAFGGRLPDAAIERNVGQDYSRTTGGHLVNRLLDNYGQPDALVTYSGAYPTSATKALRDRGIEPGRDVAFATFDDPPDGNYFYPPLTATDSDASVLGARAVELLRAREDDGTAVPVQEVLPPRLTVRESTTMWRPR